jgi:uncharacterized protein YidB (DUF937 family)
MGLLDSVVGALSSAQGNTGGGADLMKIVGELFSQPQTGGLQGLVSAFTSGGLGDVVSSWIGKGENLPISADQIMSVLGNQVQSLSASTGQNPEQLSSLLSEHLPGLVDKLTPDGAVPDQDPLSAGLGALKGLFG